MTAEPIVLPAAPPDSRRPPIPFVAAIVPVVAGVVLWQVTGSVMALCFALLGPLMIGGSLLDGIRLRRRERRRLAAETDAAWQRAEEEIAERRGLERDALWIRHPDALRCLTAEPLREDGPPSADTLVVVGRGEQPSTLRLSGGDGERAREARGRARVLDDAPVTVRLGRGICIRGSVIAGEAVLRALVAQLCLRFPPSRMALVGGADGWAFAHASGGSRSVFRLGVGRDAGAAPVADAVLWLLPSGAAVPEGVTAVLDVLDPRSALLRTADGTQQVAVECLSGAQIAAIAGRSAQHAPVEEALPGRVGFAGLRQPDGPGLAVILGRGTADEMTVDLVSDGPHAMVTGMTGAGKSELLVTWVSALAAHRGPDEVTFVLADFKGGTAFDALAALPHVSAVLTDLDDSEAGRGVGSLTAELRRRERVLADAGARDIDDARVRLPRLVIVIDEFAALLQEHPDLAAVFTDIAARGRALGMHLILGTQRAAGVIRDALAANCPLRISLRVADTADSRLVIGSDEAALLEGGAEARGIAFVRRPRDASAMTIRVALTGADDIEGIAARWQGAARQPSPWLPALPAVLPLDELPPAADRSVVIGRADEPERQAQPVVRLRIGLDRGFSVVGGAGAGKTALLRALQVQRADALLVPGDAEGAWDAVMDLAARRPELLLFDDVDRVVAALPAEYALALVERLELFLRQAQDSTCVLTFGRSTGTVARLLDALPERMLLRLSSRGEHLAAGGDSAAFLAGRPPGRGRFAGRELQVAWTTSGRAPGTRGMDAAAFGGGADQRWSPQRSLIGVIGSGGAALQRVLTEAFPGWSVRGASGAQSQVPLEAPPEAPRGSGTILVGDAEEWQREWTLLQRVRHEGEALVLAEHPSALRVLMGMRELPPYARTHAGRAWRVIDGGAPSRVILPEDGGA